MLISSSSSKSSLVSGIETEEVEGLVEEVIKEDEEAEEGAGCELEEIEPGGIRVRYLYVMSEYDTGLSFRI
jgi:hypothetical protein